jgi:hypothetical protein
MSGIVGVIVRVVPDGGESGCACRGGRAGEVPLLLPQPDEIDEILDLPELFGGKVPELLDQGVNTHNMVPSRVFRTP